jgi:MscS family membrane protein
VYITKVNLREFMQVKNTLNLHILDLMQEEGCEFAFPTTTVDLPERK